MTISQNDHLLNRAIIKENVNDFANAIKSGASLESASGEPKISSNEQIQAMIDFVNAHKETQKDIIVTLLKRNPSLEKLVLLAGYDEVGLQEFIEDDKDKLDKLENYRDISV